MVVGSWYYNIALKILTMDKMKGKVVMGVSLKPSNAVVGGLIDDVNVEWKECRFESWDYNGKSPVKVPALKVTMADVDTGDEHEQYWSMGSAKDWAPGPDGKELISVGSATALKSNSNGMILLTSLVNAGFPEEKFGDDVSELEGMVCHMIRVPAPKRTGLVKDKRTREDGREFEETVLVVESISKLPWEKAKPKPKVTPAGTQSGAGKKKPTSSGGSAGGGAGANAELSSDIVSRTVDFIMEVLGESGGEVAKKDLATMAFQKLKDDPNRNQIVQLVFKDEFLSGGAGPWTFENGIVKI